MKDEKEYMPFADRVAIVVEVYDTVCQLYVRFSRHDSEHVSYDMKLRGHQGYIDMYYQVVYIVNAGRHEFDFGREGLIYNSSFVFNLHLNERF